jgi:hypothetical protein
MQVVYNSPSVLPHGLGPPRTRTARGYCNRICREKLISMKSLMQLKLVGDQIEQGRPGRERPFKR